LTKKTNIILIGLVFIAKASLSYASYFECPNGNDPSKGPPWDPCRLFESKDVPSNHAQANNYNHSLTERAKEIRLKSISINKIEEMGLLGSQSEKGINGVSLEFLMWESAYKKQEPSQKLYKSSDFYSGMYGYTFKYFLPPFNYQKGWLYCQPLNFIPTDEQINKATDIINKFNIFINAILTPYKSKNPQNETAQQLIKRQKEFNEKVNKNIDDFKYNQYIKYAREQFNLYEIKQSKILIKETHFLNENCLKQTIGKTTIN
jgi:hypothetical protein